MQEAVPGAVEPRAQGRPVDAGGRAPRARRRDARDVVGGRRRATATEIVVIVPALASKLEAATGAVDDRRADAEQTALSLTRRLSRPGISVRGEVGADDPCLAADDALRTFGADAIVVAGDADVAEQIRGRVTVPVTAA